MEGVVAEDRTLSGAERQLELTLTMWSQFFFVHTYTGYTDTEKKAAEQTKRADYIGELNSDYKIDVEADRHSAHSPNPLRRSL